MAWTNITVKNWTSTWEHPAEMLEWLHRTGRADKGENARRGRLLCAHLCRYMRPHLEPLYAEYSFNYNMIPESIENVAEGKDVVAELGRLHKISVQIQDHYDSDEGYGLFDIVNWSLEEFYGVWVPSSALNTIRWCGVEYDIVWVCDLIRELYQPDFQLNRSNLTDGVVKIAQSIYEERRFGELPILADAMEDIGYYGMILNHFRNKCGHVLGCWGLDQVLGKE